MEIRIPLPRVDGGLVSNLVALAGLVMVCVAIGLLTDWRWALLVGGAFTFAVAVWAQRGMVPAAEVRPIRPATAKNAA